MSDEAKTVATQSQDYDSATYGEELAVGALAGEYAIVRTIASGGCGTVYEARHRMLGRAAAVKVLSREMAGKPEMVERFLREARAVNLIRHKAIVDIFEFGHLPDGRPFHVMELLRGSDLDRYIRRHGRMTPQVTLQVLEPICAALGAAHAAGIVHRDLKASNISVAFGPDEPTVKLLDFGIAKLLHPEPGMTGLTSAGRRLGTSHTMAPEQIRGERIDTRVDIYALGVLLYHMLTGRYPYVGSMEEIERLHLVAPTPRVSDAAPLPPAYDAIVERCMAKRPDDRYATVEEVLDAFRTLVAGKQVDIATAADAVAIYVDLRHDDPDGADDDVLDRIDEMLDLAGRSLREAGFTIAMQVGNTMLGISELDPGDPGAGRRRALDRAALLHTQLLATTADLPGFAVGVSVHCDRVLTRRSARGNEYVGGDLLRVAKWAFLDGVVGLEASAEATAGLDGLTVRVVERTRT